MSETVTYTVPAMTCDHCKASVSKALSAVPGVASVDVDLASKLVTVTGSSLDGTVLQGAIAKAGYEVA